MPRIAADIARPTRRALEEKNPEIRQATDKRQQRERDQRQPPAAEQTHEYQDDADGCRELDHLAEPRQGKRGRSDRSGPEPTTVLALNLRHSDLPHKDVEASTGRTFRVGRI